MFTDFFHFTHIDDFGNYPIEVQLVRGEILAFTREFERTCSKLRDFELPIFCILSNLCNPKSLANNKMLPNAYLLHFSIQGWLER